MSTIQSNSSVLLQSILSLSAQTQPATSGASSSGSATPPAPATDTLSLTGSAQPTDLVAAFAQIEQQNQFSALADPAAALAANQSATAFLGAQPHVALAAAGNLDAASALSLADS